MIVHYHKLDKLLKDKKISKTKFYKDIKILPSEMSKLRSNRILSFATYLKICAYLDCDIDDFMEVISTSSEENESRIDISLLMKDSYKTPLDKLRK